MRQVGWLAIAPQQTDEQANDARMALRAEDREGGHERASVAYAGALEVTLDHRRAQLVGDVASRILDQRHQVVGGMARGRVLKVEQAAGLYARPLAQPQQVVLMIIAQHQGGRRRWQGA